MAKKKGIKIVQRQASTETLSNIFSAIAQELTKSAIAADIMRLRMKNVYERHTILKQFEPSKIRLVTAKVSLPVAFDSHKSGQQIDPGLSKDQIASMIHPEIPSSLKSKIVDQLIGELGNSNRFTNPKLSDEILKHVSKFKVKGLEAEKHIDVTKVNKFRNEWVANPVIEQEARFVYKADDLEKLNPANIVKFDITLDIS